MQISNLPAVIESAAKSQGLVPANVNLMLPSQTYGAVLGAFDKVTLEVIQIDPDPKNGDVFEPGTKGKFALGKVPLERIANALSIQWHPQYTGIVESTATRSRAKAVGIMRKPNGETITQTDEKTIDLVVVEDELREKAEKDAEGGRILKWENGYPVKEPWKNDREREESIEREVKKGLMQKRKFKDELALTGAKDRVIRAFIATKSTYTREELSKPFAFPRVSIDTSKMLDDPRTRQTAIGMIGQATASLYGSNVARDIPAEVVPSAPITEEAERIVGPEAEREALPEPEDMWTDEPAVKTDPRAEKAMQELVEWLASGQLSPKALASVQAIVDKGETDVIILEDYVRRARANAASVKAAAAS